MPTSLDRSTNKFARNGKNQKNFARNLVSKSKWEAHLPRSNITPKLSFKGNGMDAIFTFFTDFLQESLGPQCKNLDLRLNPLRNSSISLIDHLGLYQWRISQSSMASCNISFSSRLRFPSVSPRKNFAVDSFGARGSFNFASRSKHQKNPLIQKAIRCNSTASKQVEV